MPQAEITLQIDALGWLWNTSIARRARRATHEKCGCTRRQQRGKQQSAGLSMRHTFSIALRAVSRSGGGSATHGAFRCQQADRAPRLRSTRCDQSMTRLATALPRIGPPQRGCSTADPGRRRAAMAGRQPQPGAARGAHRSFDQLLLNLGFSNSSPLWAAGLPAQASSAGPTTEAQGQSIGGRESPTISTVLNSTPGLASVPLW